MKSIPIKHPVTLGAPRRSAAGRAFRCNLFSETKKVIPLQSLARSLVLAFVLTMLFSACSDPSGIPGSTTSRITITLPAYPPDRPAMRGWLMVQAGAPPTVLPPAARGVTVIVDKNQCAPFLFYPLTGTIASELSLRFFAPAGCVYPANTSATWQDGFGADICLDLLSRTASDQTPEQRRAFCNRFNWQRLSSEVTALEQGAAAVPGGVSFNPWNLNRQKIITAISAGKFTKTTLKGSAKDKPASVTVDLASGTASPIYYQPYVLAPPLIPTGDPGALTVLYRANSAVTVLFDQHTGSVLLVCPQASPGKNYRLAVLPPEHYTWGK